MKYWHELWRTFGLTYLIIGITALTVFGLISVVRNEPLNSFASLGVFGGIFTVMGIIFTGIFIKTSLERTRCLTGGLGTWGTIESIESTSFRSGATRYQRAIIKGDDGRYYQSKEYNPQKTTSGHHPQVSDRVFVYIDTNNPDRFWVEMATIERALTDHHISELEG